MGILSIDLNNINLDATNYMWYTSALQVSAQQCWVSLPPRLWNTGLVSSGAILTSWGEGASLALVGHPSSDGVTIKMPYGVDVLHWPASHPIFSYWVG